MTEQEGKNKGGRPSKYTPEVLEQTRHYLEHFEEYKDDLIPSIAGLSLVIGVSRKVIHDWKKGNDPEKAEFRNMLDKLLSKQEQMLVSNGLKGEFNATITKLVLTKHDYSDQQQVGNQPGNVFQIVIGNDDADCA